MELTQLRAFRTVAETQSFTRAAERLNLTQSAVSRQIGALEHELGEPLFVRGRRVVRLTGFGERTLTQVTRILDDLDGLAGQGSAASQQPTGQVHAAAATQAFVYLFAPLFQSFMREHPGILLSFRTTPSTDQTLVDILDGAVDVRFPSRPVAAPFAAGEPALPRIPLAGDPRRTIPSSRGPSADPAQNRALNPSSPSKGRPLPFPPPTQPFFLTGRRLFVRPTLPPRSKQNGFLF